VFANCHFKFTYALTWIHTLFTLAGMVVFARAGMFEVKKLPARKLIPLAAAYVAYIVLCNLSLNINTVGFYQVRVQASRLGCSCKAGEHTGVPSMLAHAREYLRDTCRL
jgi:hypothetical protein